MNDPRCFAHAFRAGILNDLKGQVLEQLQEPSYRLAQRARGLLWDLGTAADILVWSRLAFDSRLHLKVSLPATVVREGVLLHGG